MNVFQSVISGVIQGLTEFFPVSSSGHLVILHSLFRIDEPCLTFDIALHVGTLAAVVVYFRKDILRLFRTDKKTALAILVGTMPALAVGVLMKERIENFFARPRIVCAMLILTGAWLTLASFAQAYYNKRQVKRTVGWKEALVIGAAQAAAIMPGISRSGATIATGTALGIDSEEVFRFSFLLSLPAVAGASILKLPKAMSALSHAEIVNYLAGTFTAALVGILVLRALANIIRLNRLYLFGLYCALVGLIACWTLSAH